MMFYAALVMKYCKEVKMKHFAAAAVIIVCLILRIVWRYYSIDWQPDVVCFEDFNQEYGEVVCRPRCLKGHFSLPGMDSCETNLGCREIHAREFETSTHTGAGAVKSVHLAKWKGRTVALNSLISRHVGEDFKHGLAMLKQFSGSPFTTQFLGYCKQSYVTEYHPFGDASKFYSLIQRFPYLRDSIKARFGFCINYVQILNFLHSRPEGAYVMCDSNSLLKTLQQFLIRSDFQLLANDLDALPLVDKVHNKTIKCGHRLIQGEFAAPEQRWTINADFVDELLPGYNEKTDIWNIPDVCEYFLGDSTDGVDSLKFHLFKIHSNCKSEDQKSRPTSEEVLKEYMRIYNLL